MKVGDLINIVKRETILTISKRDFDFLTHASELQENNL